MSFGPFFQSLEMTAFIAGCTGTVTTYNGFDLTLQGADIYSLSGPLTCFISGMIAPSGSGLFPLFLTGAYGVVEDSIPFVIAGQGEEGYLPLFTRGIFTNSTNPLVGGSGLTSDFPLYMMGTGVNPYVPGTTGNLSSSINLSLVGYAYSTSGNLSLYTYGIDVPQTNTVRLFTAGSLGSSQSGINLFTSGIGYISNEGIELFIRGY